MLFCRLLHFVQLLEEAPTIYSVIGQGPFTFISTQHPHIMLLILMLAYDCDYFSSKYDIHISTIGGSSGSDSNTGSLRIYFGHSAIDVLELIGACILFMIVILLFYKIKTYILLTRSLVDIADLVILVAFFTLTHLSLILLQR